MSYGATSSVLTSYESHLFSQSKYFLKIGWYAFLLMVIFKSKDCVYNDMLVCSDNVMICWFPIGKDQTVTLLLPSVISPHKNILPSHKNILCGCCLYFITYLSIFYLVLFCNYLLNFDVILPPIVSENQGR